MWWLYQWQFPHLASDESAFVESIIRMVDFYMKRTYSTPLCMVSSGPERTKPVPNLLRGW